MRRRRRRRRRRRKRGERSVDRDKRCVDGETRGFVGAEMGKVERRGCVDRATRRCVVCGTLDTNRQSPVPPGPPAPNPLAEWAAAGVVALPEVTELSSAEAAAAVAALAASASEMPVGRRGKGGRRWSVEGGGEEEGGGGKG